jgi:hypothetical protein
VRSRETQLIISLLTLLQIPDKASSVSLDIINESVIIIGALANGRPLTYLADLSGISHFTPLDPRLSP